MIINNGISIEERRTATNSKSLVDTKQITLSIQAEFLDSCAFNCAGCFVKRRNTYTDKELLDLKRFVQQFDNKYELNELVLSPTDMFGASNTIEIISNPLFISLFQHFNALTFNSTLLSEPSHIKSIMEFIRENYPQHIYYEMFVVLDIEKFLVRDKEYIERLETNLNELSDVNIIFVYNIHSSEMFDNVDIPALSHEVNIRYNSHFRMNPSFFRTHKKSIILNALNDWRTRLRLIYDDVNTKDMLFNMIDPYFGSNTYITLTAKNGNLYLNPYIYDNIFDNSETVLNPVEGMTVEKLSELITELQLEQFEYSKGLECDNCVLLSSCVGRNVLTFMKNQDIKECFLPKDIMLKANLMVDENRINS